MNDRVPSTALPRLSAVRTRARYLAACVGLLSACATGYTPDAVTSGKAALSIQTSAGSLPAPHQPNPAGAVACRFGVLWPNSKARQIEALPDNTQAVTFLISQGNSLVQSVTVIRSSGEESVAKTIMLYPGDYTVRARAFATDSPTAASPVTASGAANLTVLPGGGPQTVDIQMTIVESPAPASPWPVATSDPSGTPSPNGSSTPTPSPSPNISPTPDMTPRLSLINPGITFNDGYFVDFNHGWVVGNGGAVRYTSNGGTSWVSQSAGSYALRSVFFLSAGTGWTGGDQGSVYRTSDGGANWTACTLPGSATVVGIWFSSPTQGYVMATSSGLQNGGVYQTSDGGSSWNLVTAGMSIDRYFGASSSGLLFFSDPQYVLFQDGGTWGLGLDDDVRWQSAYLPWFASPPGDSNKVIIGKGNWLWRSVDGGSSFSRLERTINGDVDYSVWLGLGFVTGSEGLGIRSTGGSGRNVFETVDGGSNWNLVTSWTPTNDPGYSTMRGNVFDRRHAWFAANTQTLARLGRSQ